MLRRPPRSTLFPYTSSSDLYVDHDRPAHIWVTTVPAAGATVSKPKQLTSGEFGASNPQWSHDGTRIFFVSDRRRSEEHTSELQSRLHLVCRLLLEKKNKLIL